MEMPEKKTNRQQQFDDVFDLLSMLIGSNFVTLYDVKDQVTRYSPAIVEMVGLPGEYIPDGMCNWADYIHPEDRSKYETTMGEMLSMRQHTYDLNYRVRLKNGEYSMFRLVGGMIRDAGGRPSIAGGMMIHAGRVDRLDRVTSLRNLNAFFEDLVSDSQLYQKLHVLLVGFGRLAHINEIYGYSHGSRLLKQIGDRLTELIGSDAKLYRMEGSRFAILSHKLDADGMAALYEQIRTAYRDGFLLDGITHNLVAYGGLMTADHLPNNEERSLYDCLLHAGNESRQYHHGSLVIYNGSNIANPDVSSSISLISAIRKSINNDYEGFHLKYQPIFNKSNTWITAVEALLYWKDAQFGDIPPARFLSEISNDFSYEKLSYWFLKKVMLDGVEFLSVDHEEGFLIFVTVSPSQIYDTYFAGNLEELARETGFPLSHLTIELSRECRMLELQNLSLFCDSLRAKGVSVGLDDFARGNAWLKTFSTIQPNHVRFSEELTENLACGSKDSILFTHLIRMIDACDAKVFVKGVKQRSDLDFFAALPVSGMQGSRLSDPLYYDEVIEYYDTEDTDHE